MHKATAFFFILFLGMTVLLTAQETPDIEVDWDDYSMDLYTRGDQTFTISLGVVFPTLFFFKDENMNHQITPPVGGTGSLAYYYYFNSFFFTGFEVGIMVLPTLANNALYIIPLGARAGTQFIKGRFEFPVYMSFGMAWQNYLNLGYYGIYARAGGGAFFRPIADWSFGLSTSWSWFPQWTNEPSKNVAGNFVDLTLSARYHF